MERHNHEMRAVYGQTLNELMDENPNIVCVEADLSLGSGTNPRVAHAHPDNFVNVGVCEANMIGVAAGLARGGKIPFCATFSGFATRRTYDQITISVAYAGNNVKIVGTAPGITNGSNGGTHICFQDLAIMRAMPNMHVYSPCDVYELRAVLKHMAAGRQPTYMQLIRPVMDKVFDENCAFDPEKAVVIRQGKDVTLVSTGLMTQFTVKVVDRLGADGLDVELLHYPSVKPFDADTLVRSAEKTRAVVTVENQSIIGGLGGAVCETLSERLPTPVRRLGVPDRFGEVGAQEYLLDKFEFGPKHIADACTRLAASKGPSN